jgi:hypothetical protein
MDFWNNIGAMYQFFPDTPALAVDMALKGPQTDVGYALAYGLQNTQTPLDVYPADTQTLAG